MNKLMLTISVAACGILSAQSSQDVLKFNLTQPATVTGVELPAGACTVALMNTGSGNTALLFRCESGAQAFALVNPVAEPVMGAHKPAGVVLLHDSAGYRITEVWLSGAGRGFEVVH